MTLPEAVEAVRQAGAVLDVDEAGPVLRGHVPAEVVSVLRRHKARVRAVLQLREVHRYMGLTEEDVLFVEVAMLSGRIKEVRVVSRPPEVTS